MTHDILKIGVALINKGWLCLRLQNQLWNGTSMIWENNLWYTKVNGDVEP
jgi:hypothetical protein